MQLMERLHELNRAILTINPLTIEFVGYPSDCHESRFAKWPLPTAATPRQG
jgi:hypothetical protein